jgi:hypothetical protein
VAVCTADDAHDPVLGDTALPCRFRLDRSLSLPKSARQ